MPIGTWITKEGQVIKIVKMTSGHLLSTIHFIERNRFNRLMECALREPQNMDTYVYDDETIQYYSQWPEQYEALIAEAQRRKLIYRKHETPAKKPNNKTLTAQK